MDVKSPRCEMVGCRKQPCCGYPGLKPRFCSEHKQNGMLNLKVGIKGYLDHFAGRRWLEHIISLSTPSILPFLKILFAQHKRHVMDVILAAKITTKG